MIIHHHRIDPATDTAPARLALGVSAIDYHRASATETRGDYLVSWFGARELLTFTGLSVSRSALLPSSVGNHTGGDLIGAYGASQAAEYYLPTERTAAAEAAYTAAAEAEAEPIAWPGAFNAALGSVLGAVFPVTVVADTAAPRELFAPVVSVAAWLDTFAPSWCLVPSVIAATAGEIVFVLVPRDGASVLAEMTPPHK